MKKDLETLKNLDTKTLVAMMYIDFNSMKEELRADYVRKEQFLPVKRCCYAITGSVFIAVLAGIVTLITK